MWVVAYLKRSEVKVSMEANMMGLYQKLRELWKSPKKTIKSIQHERLILWRREPVTIKIDRPTRLDKARSLGYKAKQGIIVVRQRINKTKRMRELPAGGRRPKHNRRRKVVSKNYQQISEERVAKKYPNMEVLNSYPVGSDGRHHFFEVILVDPCHPVIKTDKNLKKIGDKQHTNRAFRGLTSAAKKSRGLRKKGTGAEKIRPSQRANKRSAH